MYSKVSFIAIQNTAHVNSCCLKTTKPLEYSQESLCIILKNFQVQIMGKDFEEKKEIFLLLLFHFCKKLIFFSLKTSIYYYIYFSTKTS